MLNKVLTTSSTAQINIPKIATFGPMRQQPHGQLVHVIRDSLGGTAVCTRQIGIEPIPLSIVNEGRVIAEYIEVELGLDAIGVGDSEWL